MKQLLFRLSLLATIIFYSNSCRKHDGGNDPVMPGAFTKVWETALGSSRADEFSDMVQSSDGNIIAVGDSQGSDGDLTLNQGMEDVWVVKIDNNGKIIWQKSFGGQFPDYGISIAASNDGGCVITGFSYIKGILPNVSGLVSAILVAKLDGNGNLVWSKIYGGSSVNGPQYPSDIGYKVQSTPDGGYVLAGTINNPDRNGAGGGLGNIDLYVLKINSNGDSVWSKEFGGSGIEELGLISVNTKGEYYVATNSTSKDGDAVGGEGTQNVLVMKLDNNGNKLWSKMLGGAAINYLYSLTGLADGSCLIAGYSGSTNGDFNQNHGGTDGWVAKLKDDGSLEWQHLFGGPGNDMLYAATAVSDGFLLAGQSGGVGGDITNQPWVKSPWVIKIDPTGKMVKQQAFGNSVAYCQIYSILATIDGGFIIGGLAFGGISGYHGVDDGWLLKIK